MGEEKNFLESSSEQGNSREERSSTANPYTRVQSPSAQKSFSRPIFQKHLEMKCWHPVPGWGPLVGAHPQKRGTSSDGPMPSILFRLALDSVQHSLVAFCIYIQPYRPLAMDRVWAWVPAPGCLGKSVAAEGHGPDTCLIHPIPLLGLLQFSYPKEK